MSAAAKIAEAIVTQAELDAGGVVGVIRTSRHDAVRYIAGWEVGDVFGRDSDYDGPTLTLEVADAADAQAMLDAISKADAQAQENARLREGLKRAAQRLRLIAPLVVESAQSETAYYWANDASSALKATP